MGKCENPHFDKHFDEETDSLSSVAGLAFGLSLALLVLGLHWTRPSEADHREFLRERMRQVQTEKYPETGSIRSFLATKALDIVGMEYRDKYLFTQMSLDHEMLSVGLFGKVFWVKPDSR